MKNPIIGCLALQGAVELHRPHIEGAGAEFRAVKTPQHFDEIDAFILPGGESTTMLKLIANFDLWDVLTAQFAKKPVWGICAGSILIADKVLVSPKMLPLRKQGPSHSPEEDPRLREEDQWQTQKSFALLPMTIERNGYGRQLESHHAQVQGYEVSFIRAPIIKECGKDVEVKALHNGDPVWVQRGQYIATTFHPELTQSFPSPMHQAFVDLVAKTA